MKKVIILTVIILLIVVGIAFSLLRTLGYNFSCDQTSLSVYGFSYDDIRSISNTYNLQYKNIDSKLGLTGSSTFFSFTIPKYKALHFEALFTTYANGSLDKSIENPCKYNNN